MIFCDGEGCRSMGVMQKHILFILQIRPECSLGGIFKTSPLVKKMCSTQVASTLIYKS